MKAEEFLKIKPKQSAREFLNIPSISPILSPSDYDILKTGTTITMPTMEVSPVEKETFPITWAEMYHIARLPTETSKKGWKTLLDKIPDPEIKSTFVNFVLSLPKTTTEIGTEWSAEMISPEAAVLGGFGKALPYLKQIPSISKAISTSKSTMRYLSGKLPDWLKRPFVYRFGQPKEYIEQAEKRIIDTRQALSDANELGIKLSNDMTLESQQFAYKLLTSDLKESAWQDIYIIEKEWLKQQRIKKPKEFLKTVKQAREIIDETSEQFIVEGQKIGMITDDLADIVRSNKGKYLPRLYKIFEDKDLVKKLRNKEITLPEALNVPIDIPNKLRQIGLNETQITAYQQLNNEGKKAFLKRLNRPDIQMPTAFKPARIRTPFLIKRKDLTEEYKQALGEIKTAAEPTAKAIVQMKNATNTMKLFNFVNSKPEWVSETFREGFTRMPQTKSLGNLANKYIHPEIAKDLNEIIHIPTTSEKVWNNLVGLWKGGKVILNPATHSRNMLSNSILLDLSGVDLIEQPILLKKTIQSLQSKNKYYKEAQKEGLLNWEFSGVEIKRFSENFKNISDDKHIFSHLFDMSIKQPYEKLAELYQKEEQLFKLAKYIHSRQAGMTTKEATKEAEKWIFNYEKVSDAVKVLRKSPIGTPFITFSIKALPRVGEVALTNPLRLYKYEMLFKAFNTTAKEKLNLTEDEMNIIERNSRGKYIILPWRDINELPMILDLAYILPWGDVGEQGGFNILGKDIPPAFSPGGLIKPFVETGFNYNTYRKQNIFNERIDPKIDQFIKVIDHLYKNLTPSWAPAIPGVSAGGYSFHKMVSSLNASNLLPDKFANIIKAKKSDYFGRVRSIPVVLFDVILGLKTMPLDPTLLSDLEKRKLKRDFEEIDDITKKILRDAGIPDEEKEKMIEKIRENKERIIDMAYEQGIF